MVRVESLVYTDVEKKRVKITAFSDTKAEVQNGDFSNFVGLPSDAKVIMGSKVKTASGEFAYMQSTGDWKWQ